MSAVSLGDTAVVGDLKCKFVDTSLGIKTRDITVSGAAIFNGGASASQLDVAGATNLDGQVAMANSSIFLDGIPTSDPAVFGRVWRLGTDLKVSIG